MFEPVVIVGGFLSGASDYRSWQALLQVAPYKRRTYIAPIARSHWASRDDSFVPQIAAVQVAVERARRETGSEKVWLVCHSAGGRITRLWMGDKPYSGSVCGGHPFVRGIIFLGSPYTTEEPWAVRSSGFANRNYPGAFYQDIKYVSVIGKAIFGKPNGSISERLAYQSYKSLNPRDAQKWGDGVITLDSAHVPGADNLILEGIHHVGVLGRPGYTEPHALAPWGKFLLNSSY